MNCGSLCRNSRQQIVADLPPVLYIALEEGISPVRRRKLPAYAAAAPVRMGIAGLYRADPDLDVFVHPYALGRGLPVLIGVGLYHFIRKFSAERLGEAIAEGYYRAGLRAAFFVYTAAFRALAGAQAVVLRKGDAAASVEASWARSFFRHMSNTSGWTGRAARSACARRLPGRKYSGWLSKYSAGGTR